MQIRGGAGPAEAAAIAAVIAHVIGEQTSAAAVPEQRRRLSDWVMAGRVDSFVPPRHAAR